MPLIRVKGPNRLKGVVPISGSKNATLPLMCATLLTKDPVRLIGVPHLTDVQVMKDLFQFLRVEMNENDASDLTITASDPLAFAPYEIVSKMRASFWVLGPLLARLGEAKISLPGGCAIGARPVDFYHKNLEKMGARITMQKGYVEAKAPNGLHGAHIHFPVPSVGATHVLMMAATLAKGETILENVAKEPEVADVAHFLCAMGAKIEGIGTEILKIQGVTSLRGGTHHIIKDRIEAGTYAIAAAITQGDIILENVPVSTLEVPLAFLRSAGVSVEETLESTKNASPDHSWCANKTLRIRCDQRVNPVDVTTQFFPGFPTDLQSQWMALMATANGQSFITENIFENRFMQVQELSRLGASIAIHKNLAIVEGVKELTGARVMATDLRASACLILAGLAARGNTYISDIHHLDRGFEHMEKKLKNCGADIERIINGE